ncbi:MAG: methyl-accepting chemotaxis protein [Myxococcaceae bacterium]
MASPAQRIGLTWAIFGGFAFGLVLLLLGLYVVVPRQAADSLTTSTWERGRGVAREIERRIDLLARVASSSREFDEAASVQIDTIVRGEDEISGAWVVICSDTCTERDLVAKKPGLDPHAFTVALNEFNTSGRARRVELPSGEMLVADDVRSPGTPNLVGYSLIAIKEERIVHAVDQLRRTLLIALAMGFAIFLLLVFLISRLLIVRPINSMLQMASRLSEADLSGRVEGAGTHELDQLSQALNQIGQSLRDTLGRVRGVAESVAQVIDQISRTASLTSGGSVTVLTRVEETSSSMVQMLASLRGIAENVEVLYQSAEESSSSIMEMAATNEEVAENVTAMAASVEETTSAIEQMTYSIKEVAKAIEDLMTSTEGTSTAIREMDVAISQVETNAYETARLSEQVSRDAETGAESLSKTMQGIHKIKDSSAEASKVMEQLGKRIGEIGNIVDVIDDVAEQTNLLALNAAIIAAQAGEHGKGFAVVAEEIKDLAERTGASTKEIGDLIRSVQDESRNAVAAMNQGVRSVEEGVQLGFETEGALKKIQESAGRSTQMVKAIARATVEQARGSKEVTASVEKIAEAVQQINKATNEQARGSEQIMKSAEKMKMLTQHAQRSVQEQAHGSKQITKSIESINEMVTHLNRAQKEQTRGSEQVLKAVEQIKSVAEQQNRSVKSLEEAIETLRQQAEVLRGEVRRFRV